MNILKRIRNLWVLGELLGPSTEDYLNTRKKVSDVQEEIKQLENKLKTFRPATIIEDPLPDLIEEDHADAS